MKGHSSITSFHLLITLLVTAAVACGQSKELKQPLAETIAAPADTLGKPFPQPGGYVNDLYNFLRPEEEQSLDSLIHQYEQKTTIEIAVLTIDSTYANEDHFDAYTLALARNWGIGKKEKNNGILIAICPDYRRTRIQNGYGIEKYLSDQETAQILESIIHAYFSKGLYYQGIYNGIIAIMKKLEQNGMKY